MGRRVPYVREAHADEASQTSGDEQMKTYTLTFNTMEYDAEQIAAMLPDRERVISVLPEVSTRTDSYESAAVAQALEILGYGEPLRTRDRADDGGSTIDVRVKLTQQEVDAYKASEAVQNGDLVCLSEDKE